MGRGSRCGGGARGLPPLRTGQIEGRALRLLGIEEMPPEEFDERLAGSAPVQALERAVVEHAVDPAHLPPR